MTNPASRLRVVNLGLPKTGTTTLAHALRLTGMSVADYRIRRRQTKDTGLHGAFLAERFYNGYFHTGDPLEGLEAFDAFSEISSLREGHCLWPQTDWGLISAIRAHHPGTVFLASWRDPQALSDSMLRWSDLGTERLPRNNVPGLPAGYGATTAERVRWITAHYDHLRALFRDDPAFLLYDIADPAAPAQIGAHIGRKLTWWGRANKNLTAAQKDGTKAA
ncbi:sulfotransferase family protein [Seohaeicola saemankumensis]|uniref:sulfotransferase family protein n=1 Tax=Seohaeicola saemankumensis TaxID=481181 RepID=UPI001E3D5DDC|nr:sulfotransferase family protein [Seohaeicola saemankumensis]MCD1626347.1 sulfotransferase family protein [Seohaeicola saemankumensis]